MHFRTEHIGMDLVVVLEEIRQAIVEAKDYLEAVYELHSAHVDLLEMDKPEGSSDDDDIKERICEWDLCLHWHPQ